MSTVSPFRRRLLSSIKPKAPNYLCFTALESGSFTLNIGSLISTSDLPSVNYSLDGGETWINVANQDNVSVNVTTPVINSGDSVLWKSNGVICKESGANKYSRFSSTGRFKISGSLNTLLFGDKSRKNVNGNYSFFGLFFGCTKLIYADELILPTKLDFTHCFYRLFRGCSNLLTSPNLFEIDASPRNTFQEMFHSCSKLTSDILINSTKPGLQGYNNMLYGCSQLNYIKMLATDISASNCLLNWVQGVSATGIFVKNINATWTTTGNSGVPTNWTVIYYDPELDKYYLDQQRSQECDDHGNPI